jgi:hypothetical protein
LYPIPVFYSVITIMANEAHFFDASFFIELNCYVDVNMIMEPNAKVRRAAL